MRPYLLITFCALVAISTVLSHGDHGHHHHHGHHDHHAHDHDHHHHDTPEDVKFRYSKQANQPPPSKQHVHHDHAGHSHDHAHEHDHDHHAHHHDHGHDHSGHSHHHDHEEHSHSHDHDHHHHDHHSHSHDHVGSSQKVASKEEQDTLWMYALGSTTLISAAPFFILFFIPLQNNNPEYQPLLKVLLSFASGGLLGDAFLHLIPHAVEYQNHNSPHSHDHAHGHHDHDHGSGGEAMCSGPPAAAHSHGHHHHHAHGDDAHPHVHDLTIGLSVLGGIFMFLVIEKFVRLCNGGHSHSHDHGSHSHEKVKEKAKSSPPPPAARKAKEDSSTSEESKEAEKRKVQPKTHDHDHHNDIKVAGYLNLVADFTHNFTDGLAIATSYLLSTQTGIVSTVTILFHEVPHEIGDFSILIQSGFSKRKAIMMQLVTALGALSGTLVGLLAQGLGDEMINLYILPFTAGGFIYIATVSVIPELLEENKIGSTILQVIAMFLGVYLMVVITWKKMVCVPCIFIPLFLFIFHKFIRPYLFPWLEKMGVIKPSDPIAKTNLKMECEGGVCRLVKTDENGEPMKKQEKTDSATSQSEEVLTAGDTKKDS